MSSSAYSPALPMRKPPGDVTTLTVAPLEAAQSLAIFVTAGARFASVQMTMLVALEARVDADAVEVAVGREVPDDQHRDALFVRRKVRELELPLEVVEQRRAAGQGRFQRR